jgi:hypothetical protein
LSSPAAVFFLVVVLTCSFVLLLASSCCLFRRGIVVFVFVVDVPVIVDTFSSCFSFLLGTKSALRIIGTDDDEEIISSLD